MGYKKILVTLDGSPLAEQALQQIPLLAAPQSLIHVLSVVTHEPIGFMSAMVQEAYLSPVIDARMLDSLTDVDPGGNLHLVEKRRTYLEHATTKLVEAGYTVQLDVRTGDAANAIINTARDGFEVIVMATHGRTGLSKALLGSVAETVLHQTLCPVLLIPVRAPDRAN